MLLNAEELPDGSLLQGEIIIAGGGMAGLLLARQLGDAGFDVVVLESGGETPDARVQALYSGRTTLGAPDNPVRELDDYLISSRIRCLGGSGNVWGGKCAPLDPLDFERRDWIAHSGWPLSRAHLQPFYDRACDLLELPRFTATARTMLGRSEPVFADRSAHFTPRPRCYTRYTGAIAEGPFREYKQAAAGHPRVRIYLRANLTHIRLASDGQRVASLELRCLDGRRHVARAGTYVLAMGGVENARLLLASNDVHRGGIGNHSDWLGRAFQGHTVIVHGAQTALALMCSRESLAVFDNTKVDGPHVVLGASDHAQRQLEGVNFTATLRAVPEADTDVAKSVRTMARHVAGAPSAAHALAYFMLEHTPNRDSRVTLDLEDRDELRLPRARLDIRYNALEIDRFDASLAMLVSELGRLGAGRVQWTGTREGLVSAMSLSRHHMGTTRMAVSAGAGVVDEHCRVHGVRNLYVAGSSVFPTSGIANPTLTLLALAFRLGDHLRARRGASA